MLDPFNTSDPSDNKQNKYKPIRNAKTRSYIINDERRNWIEKQRVRLGIGLDQLNYLKDRYKKTLDKYDYVLVQRKEMAAILIELSRTFKNSLRQLDALQKTVIKHEELSEIYTKTVQDSNDIILIFSKKKGGTDA